MKIIQHMTAMHRAVFIRLENLTDGWFLGLLARFVFFAVLYFYFLNSFGTKVGDGFAGFFSIQDSAYYQIALPAVDTAGGNIAAVPFLPWGLIVFLGTYCEFLLPLMVVLGLFTRIAALGMIGFIAVQTLVDITVHQVGPETVGALFDRFSDSLIADQRTLWIFPLIYLVIKGAGAISLDRILAGIFAAKNMPQASMPMMRSAT
ncbi:DoxX family protein [Rhizobium sp. L1K21]|uniref:DoxX family protein n=1 Tax=Rhizobium sp. L1K21 TaxID=2954933 RepID=UPI002092BDF3|nr:DoxX family protein [Rhizobium sp. L1K21]MCO6185021.1 DoxX family protein [Rhizobium sp. L1K21]